MAPMTKEQVNEILSELGLTEAEDGRHPWWARLKCRLMGPHQWTPIWEVDTKNNNAITETGFICEVCKKERI